LKETCVRRVALQSYAADTHQGIVTLCLNVCGARTPTIVYRYNMLDHDVYSQTPRMRVSNPILRLHVPQHKYQEMRLRFAGGGGGGGFFAREGGGGGGPFLLATVVPVVVKFAKLP